MTNAERAQWGVGIGQLPAGHGKRAPSIPVHGHRWAASNEPLLALSCHEIPPFDPAPDWHGIRRRPLRRLDDGAVALRWVGVAASGFKRGLKVGQCDV